MRIASFIILVLVACRPPPRADPQLSTAEHVQRANQQEQEADELEVVATDERAEESPGLGLPPVDCVDLLRWPDLTSGGATIQLLPPCWTLELPAERHEREAAQLRRQAERHRRAASDLTIAERESCRGIGEAELSRNAFTHRAGIADVSPYRERDRLAGATILLRKMPGRSAQSVRRVITCHRARAAAMGYPPTFLSESPAVLPDVVVTVAEHNNGIAVTVRSWRADVATTILQRANDLVHSKRGGP